MPEIHTCLSDKNN